MQHSSFVGGSTAARRLRCPGSYSLELSKRRTESPWALRGTALHAVMERLLTGYTHAPGDNLSDFLGQEVEGVVIDDDHSLALQSALSGLLELKAKAAGFTSFVTEALVEYPGGWNDRPVFGTVDVLARGGDGRLYVIDFKFGHVKVNPAFNEQLGFYAGLALISDFDKDVDEEDQIVYGSKGITCAIIQPANDPVLQTWETDDEWVLGLLDRLQEAMQDAVSDKPTFHVGNHCRWCHGRELCKAYAETTSRNMTMIETTSWADLDDHTLGGILTRAEQAEQAIKHLRKHVWERLSLGAEIPGWGLKESLGNRRWIDNKTAEKKLALRGLRVKDRYTKKVISPTQAEKKLSKEAYAKHLAPLVERPPRQPKLVKLDTGPVLTGRARTKDKIKKLMEGKK